MTAAILSFYSGRLDRGVETWAQNLAHRLPGVGIISGLNAYLPWKWFPTDILIPTNGRLQVFICRLVSWLLGKPMIVFGHSGLGADDKWNLWCCPDVFVCFTHAQADWARRFVLPWTKITVISHAVDTRLFTPGRRPRPPTVLCVGASDPQKRTFQVSAAVKLLPGVKLLLVGPGQPLQVSFSQMPSVYRQASIFCLVPQPCEAFGLVFLEAMASNLPVVATDDPVRREIVGPAGIFVAHPENPHQLASALRLALDKDWGHIPRRQALKFSWDKILKEYSSLFKSVCSRQSSLLKIDP